MTKNNFPQPDRKSINDQEKEILKFWKAQDIFEKTISTRPKQNEFRFFDGPPFATGSPHYGHILAGAIKDMIPRYKTMNGFRVDRKWGWDCHGVPVEFLVEKEHKIGGKPGIEEMGVGKFNELCRDAVMRCADEWEDTVERMGRFVDFKNDYKTMDPEFMESVWWVFKTLWDKGLIYEGEKVVPYSPKLGSPLSNFEANLNYKMVQDPTATVEFELEDGSIALAWTTTPWTLPSNVAIGFGRDLEYSKITINSKIGILAERGGNHDYGTGDFTLDSIKYDTTYIIATDALPRVLKNIDMEKDTEDVDVYDKIKERNGAFSIEGKLRTYKIEKAVGKDFLNTSYKPLFPFFKDDLEKRFIALHDEADYITTDAGTGIVHFAPSFGEEDANLCHKFDVKGVNPIDENGYFDNQIPALEGIYFRADEEVDGSKIANANKWVLSELKENGTLFSSEQETHDYPFCWRTDCALMYRGIKTWFVNVTKIKEMMIEKNKDINWLPEHLKEGRFGKILETAPDWAISRNRYWGAPIPVWRCENEECQNIHVMGSRKNLEDKAKKEVNDLHKHFVDDLTWSCEKCEGKMVRIPEVLDCWFESGSMPYASVNYPFAQNSADDLEKNLTDFQSADFIAEGLDQTRGWFYTLHVLGCALFEKNIFKNVVTNGIVLAEDGQKMSKSKKNYPNPNIIFEKYGADAMRFYMLSSPVVKAENFRFSEHGVSEVLKNVILPLKSTYQFFSTYANIDEWRPTKITFIRHGQGTHNVEGIYSGKIDNPHPLTDKGVADITALKEKLPTFDKVFASPFVRTKQTADILFGENNYELDKRIVEIDFGDLEGETYRPVLERLKDKSGESLAETQARMASFVREIGEKFPGKNVAAVAHGGPIRYGRGFFSGYDTEEKVLNYEIIKPGETANLIVPPNPKTELDQWILGELQVLLKDFREKMDAYKLDEALRGIPDFIDNLNNWFLRRSRKRFWANGMTEEKRSGYEILFHVLLTLSKILAPTCPFFAEKLFKDLTNFIDEDLSVHLRYLPYPDEKMIDDQLSKKTAIMREIVSLAAGIRARTKIKLRQPLAKVSFSSTDDVTFEDADLQIIKEEANVKNIEILSTEEVTKFAKKIVKVDARQVGRKFGKKVQQLIVAGKNGEFTELENGQIKVADETLESGEYEVSFVCEGDFEADSTARTVVLLDAVITEDLRIEGFSREIIRAIQEKRKNDGFEISDRINIQYSTDSEDLKSAFRHFETQISAEVLADNISEKANGEATEIDGQACELKISKA